MEVWRLTYGSLGSVQWHLLPKSLPTLVPPSLHPPPAAHARHIASKLVRSNVGSPYQVSLSLFSLLHVPLNIPLMGRQLGSGVEGLPTAHVQTFI